MWRGLLGFLLFWVVALAAGVLLVVIATGARAGWLLLALVPLALFAWLAWLGRRTRSRRRLMPEDRDVER